MSETVTTPALSRRREQTRARLLDAAHEVFAEVGMDAASVEVICERAGFTRGAFYSNFGSKEELFLALITQLSEEKLAQVAERVRGMSRATMADLSGAVRTIVGESLGEQMEPQLISEMRTQALRDPRLAGAYLAWRDAMSAGVEAIIAHVVATYGLQVRLPLDETARLLLEVSEDTVTRAMLEGLSRAQMARLLNDRIAGLVGVLVEQPPVR